MTKMTRNDLYPWGQLIVELSNDRFSFEINVTRGDDGHLCSYDRSKPAYSHSWGWYGPHRLVDIVKDKAYICKAMYDRGFSREDAKMFFETVTRRLADAHAENEGR